MKYELPVEVMKRSRLVGFVVSIATVLILGALLIPNMESGLVLVPIFGLSGVAGALSSGFIRYRARQEAFRLDRTRPKPTPALTALGWVAVVLSVYAALVILNTWFLVPGDPAHTTAENVQTKLKIMLIAAIALVGLISTARWSFRKRVEAHRSTRLGSAASPPDYIRAHQHCIENRAEVEASVLCGCFYCMSIYPSSEIEDWIDDQEALTADCPRCGIDAVIGSASGFPITSEFLNLMNAHWFEEHSAQRVSL